MTSEGTNFYTTGNIHHYQEQAQQYQQINNQYNSQYNNSLYGNTYGGQYNQPYPTGLNYVPPPTKTSWLSAFGTGSLDNEPSLLEELEINPKHMCDKTFSVLNPFRSIDGALVEDADCWGPILFLLLFAASLLLAGKSLFSFIYGVAAIGLIGIYTILNLMSETGIDGQRTISVLGYCLLPMAILSWISIALPLQ